MVDSFVLFESVYKRYFGVFHIPGSRTVMECCFEESFSLANVAFISLLVDGQG